MTSPRVSGVAVAAAVAVKGSARNSRIAATKARPRRGQNDSPSCVTLFS
jgi:hypothetical protein